MNTVNKYGMEWAGPRRKASWKRRLGCWLWSLIWMVLASLALWGLFAWATGRVTGLTGVTSLTMAKPAAVRMAGFGVPEGVALGVVVVIVGMLLWRLVCGARLEADEERERCYTTTVDAGDWLPCLVEWFARRHVMLSRGQALDMRRICVPDHRRALVELDQYLRQRMKLRLWMTSLLEVQQICLRGEPEMVVVGAGNGVVRADWTGVSFGKDQVGGNAIPPSDKAATFEALTSEVPTSESSTEEGTKA